jgi:hypothetical protein
MRELKKFISVTQCDKMCPGTDAAIMLVDIMDLR